MAQGKTKGTTQGPVIFILFTFYSHYTVIKCFFFFYQALELKETEPKMKQGIEYFGKLALN